MISETIITETKAKSITAYLLSQNIQLDGKRSSKKYSFFHSPFGGDKTASFVVNESKNTFYDHSKGFGGDIIKACELIEKVDFQTAVQRISGLSLQTIHLTERKESDFKITEVKQLENLHLEDYLHYTRKINTSLAFKYLHQVHFTSNTKKQYAIGFKNDKGGFELRNEFIKIATSPKWFTTIPGTKRCSVFEGFMDFLSAITFFNMQPTDTCIILNSANLVGHVDFSPYTKIRFFGDADTAGDKCLSQIPNAIDARSIFKGYKDFNDFLVQKA